MSRSHKLRLFVTQRLNAAGEEIMAMFEETILKLEEEAALSQQVISRQHALLCALNKSMMESPAADVFTKQLMAAPIVDPVLHRQNQNPHRAAVLDPPHDGEKPGEPLPALDATEIIQFTYSSRPTAKGLQPSADPAPADPKPGVTVVLSSDTEDSDDYDKDAAEPGPASLEPSGHPGPRPGDGLSCQACNRAFSARRFLFRHLRAHGQDPMPVCGLCRERFDGAAGLKRHLQTHARKKVEQNQARTRSREKRLQQLHDVDRNVEATESRKPEEPSRTDPERRRSRPRSRDKHPDNQQLPKKRKRSI